MADKFSINGLLSISAALSLLILAGCATKPPAPKQYAFFPKPPDEPRVQFLVGFSAESGLFGFNKFKNFVLGDQKVQRPIFKPYGVTARKGKIYIADTSGKTVETIDLEKERLSYLRTSGEGKMVAPINVAVDETGTKFVTDTTLGKVMIYSEQGEFLGSIGNPKEMRPVGVAVDGTRLYVTDLTGHRVVIYDKGSRKLLLTLPKDPNDEKSMLRSPTNVAIDQQGRVYVTDTGSFNVQVYDAEGNHLRTIGEQGLTPGRFAMPKGVGVDREGRVYVADAATQVVQIFNDQGQPLMFFGDPAIEGPGETDLPAGLTVDYENVPYFQKFAAPGFSVEHLIILVNQFGTQKISVFGFGRKG